MTHPLRTWLYRRKKAFHDWQARYRWDRRHKSEAQPIVIGGCGRSGTTLVRVILDSHSELLCGPETNLLVKPLWVHHRPAIERLSERFAIPIVDIEAILRLTTSHADFVTCFFARAAQRVGKSRWADKTPANIRHLDWLFAHFPEARFVHVIRDGRDVVCSLRTHPRHKVVDGELIPLDTDNPIEECVARWVGDVELGLAWRDDPRVLELRYEDLVADPDTTIRALCADLDLPFEDAMLHHEQIGGRSRDVEHFPQNPEAQSAISGKRVERWRTDLTAEQLAYVLREAGPLLDKLGYV
ncbi:MAG: sulfotransferase [Acidobacteriota bacterium]